MKRPVFVVTGAPNKGKSTFIKAMTNNEQIVVAEHARTTEISIEYPFRIGGQTLLSIWDTPGFENAHEMYELMQGWGLSESDQPLELFRRFVDTCANDPEFRYEVQIFRPVLDFAGIVYVADCSKPFSREEFMREIELIRLTRLPSIAILNPIDSEEHVASWRQQIQPYFKITKVFNPHRTTFDEKLSVLGAFSHLHDEWESQISHVIGVLKKEREQVLEECARIIRSTLLMLYDTSFHIPYDAIRDEQEHKKDLLEVVRNHVQEVMDDGQQQITRKFGLSVTVEVSPDIDDNDLFDSMVREKYLSDQQRALIGGLSGGAIGAGADTLAAGTTFGIFTVSMATLGYFAGRFSTLQPADLLKFDDLSRTLNGIKGEILGGETEKKPGDKPELKPGDEKRFKPGDETKSEPGVIPGKITGDDPAKKSDTAVGRGARVTRGESGKAGLPSQIRVKHLNPELGLLIINRYRQIVSQLYNRTAANTEKIVIGQSFGKKSLGGLTLLLTQISRSQRARYSEDNKMKLLKIIHRILKEDQGLTSPSNR